LWNTRQVDYNPAVDLTGLKFSSASTYAIQGEIGRGGMGIVYLAGRECEGVTDHVALKTILAKSDDQEARLRQEANLATALRHENIVKTYGLETIPYSRLPEEFLQEFERLSVEDARRVQVGRIASAGKLADALARLNVARDAESRGRRLILIVMDYIEGTDVRTFHNDHLARKLLLPPPLAAFVVSRVARALAFAHQTRQIVHRDVSPENFLLNTQGVVKLTDFGVAAAAGGGSDGHLTGKLRYMAPEQAAGQPVDSRADVYALGLVLYQLLTGVSLQSVPSRLGKAEKLEFLKRIYATPFLPPDRVRTDVPQTLSDLCMVMLAIDRDYRPSRADAVLRELEQGYLYAGGFGPTNNSLQAYMELFESRFENPQKEQLAQLPFLKGELQRAVSSRHYTPEGRKLLEESLSR
jgi:serine/threonine-protein kinase